MPTVNFTESRYEAISLDYRIWINGVEVTGYVTEDGGPSWSYSGRGGKNTASFTLNNSSSNFLLTRENLLQGEWRSGGNGAYFDEGAKREMFEFKNGLNKHITRLINQIIAKNKLRRSEKDATANKANLFWAAWELYAASIPVQSLYPGIGDAIRADLTPEERSALGSMIDTITSAVSGAVLGGIGLLGRARSTGALASAVLPGGGGIPASARCDSLGKIPVPPGSNEQQIKFIGLQNQREVLQCQLEVAQAEEAKAASSLLDSQSLLIELGEIQQRARSHGWVNAGGIAPNPSRWAAVSKDKERVDDLVRDLAIGDKVIEAALRPGGTGLAFSLDSEDGYNAKLRVIRNAIATPITATVDLRQKRQDLEAALEAVDTAIAGINYLSHGNQRASKGYQHLDENQRAYSLREYECIIHKYDHVRIWARNPYSSADEWFPAFTGVVTSKPVTMDYKNGETKIAVACEDVRVLLDRMRFQRNRVATANLVPDPFVDEGYFRDVILNENAGSAYDHPLSRIGSFQGAMFAGLIGGNSLPAAIPDPKGDERAKLDKELREKLDKVQALRLGASSRIDTAIAELYEVLGRLSPGDSKGAQAAVIHTLEQVKLALTERQKADELYATIEPDLKSRDISAFGNFTTGNVVSYPGGKRLQDWYKLLLFGDLTKKHGSAIESLGFYSEAEMVSISHETKPEGTHSVLSGKVHFLQPSFDGNMIAYDIVNSQFLGTQDWERNWITRLQALEEMCELVDYEFLVTPAGDIAFEFPQADFRPSDYGEFENLLTLDLHVSDVKFEEEAGDIVTGVMATGGFAWQEYTPKLPTFASLRAVVWSPLMAGFRYGTHIETVAFPFVADREQLRALAKIAFQKKLALMNTCSASVAFRPFILPNKPLYIKDIQEGIERIVCSNSVNYSMPTWQQPSFSFDAKWVRIPTGYRTVRNQFGEERTERVFTLITGRESLPLTYKSLYPQTAEDLSRGATSGKGGPTVDTNIATPVGIVQFNTAKHTGTGSPTDGYHINVDSDWSQLSLPLDTKKIIDAASEYNETEQKNVSDTELIAHLAEAQQATGVPQGLIFGLIDATGAQFDPNVVNHNASSGYNNLAPSGTLIGMSFLPQDSLVDIDNLAKNNATYSGLTINTASITTGNPLGTSPDPAQAARVTVAATALYIQEIQKRLEADGFDPKDTLLISLAYSRGYACTKHMVGVARNDLGQSTDQWDTATAQRTQELFDSLDKFDTATNANSPVSANITCQPLPNALSVKAVRDRVAKASGYNVLACSYADSGIRVEWDILGGKPTTDPAPVKKGTGTSGTGSTGGTAGVSGKNAGTLAAGAAANAARGTVEPTQTGGSRGEYSPDAVLAVYADKRVAYRLKEFIGPMFFKTGGREDKYSVGWDKAGPYHVINKDFENLKNLTAYLVFLQESQPKLFPGKFNITQSGGYREESYEIWRAQRDALNLLTDEEIRILTTTNKAVPIKRKNGSTKKSQTISGSAHKKGLATDLSVGDGTNNCGIMGLTVDMIRDVIGTNIPELIEAQRLVVWRAAVETARKKGVKEKDLPKKPQPLSPAAKLALELYAYLNAAHHAVAQRNTGTVSHPRFAPYNEGFVHFDLAGSKQNPLNNSKYGTISYTYNAASPYTSAAALQVVGEELDDWDDEVESLLGRETP